MDEVEEIKKRIDIVEFINQYLTLRKAGRNFKALCPFHQEKTPSFMVNPELQIFKCFGCGVGGDVYEFLMKIENLTFPEALQMLADRAGVILQRRTKEQITQEKDLKTTLFRINFLAAQVFHKILLERPVGQPALEYLTKTRRIHLSIIKNFVIGYAPERPFLKEWLINKGFTANEIMQAGNPDRFSDRIIFPLFDALGNVIGFTGRVMNPDRQPKYLNSPDTTIYHKSHVVYGLHRAKKAIKEKKYSILVEGQMDVIACHQAGYENAIAASGTALTQMQLEILQRLSNNVGFAFDSDSAGEAATKRGLDMAVELGLETKVILTPSGKDPADVIAEDPSKWVQALKSARKVMDFYFEAAFAKVADPKNLTVDEKKQVAKEILPQIKKIPDVIERNHYIQMLGHKLGTSEKTIQEALGRLKGGSKPQTQPAKQADQIKRLDAESLLLALFLILSSQQKHIIERLDPAELQNNQIREIYKEVQKLYNKEGTLELKTLQKTLSPELFQKVNFLYLSALKEYEKAEPTEITDEIQACLIRIKQAKFTKIKQDFEQKIKEAETSQDKELVKKLIKEFQDAIIKQR